MHYHDGTISKGLSLITSLTDHKANIVLWSMVEMGVGIIAGSVPSLRRLLLGCLGDKYERSRESNDRNAPRSKHHTRTTGGTPIKLGSLGARGHKDTVGGGSAFGDWTELTDSESQKNIITTNDEIIVKHEPWNQQQQRSSSEHS